MDAERLKELERKEHLLPDILNALRDEERWENFDGEARYADSSRAYTLEIIEAYPGLIAAAKQRDALKARVKELEDALAQPVWHKVVELGLRAECAMLEAKRDHWKGVANKLAVDYAHAIDRLNQAHCLGRKNMEPEELIVGVREQVVGEWKVAAEAAKE